MWLTIFPGLRDIHCPKDVVHFGRASSKALGLKHFILCYYDTLNISDFLKADTELIFMKRYFGRAFLDVAIWFAFSDARPQVVQLFHFCRSSCLIAIYLNFLRFFIRKSFKIILKLDAGKETLKGYKKLIFF